MTESSQEYIYKPQIIIVDDNPANLRLLMDLLTYEGYVVRPANSGKLALAAALAAPPDLILLDVFLPDMNGYDICKELKALDAFKDVPIIFISGLDESSEKARAFACGGADFISKPFQHKEVLVRIKTQLEARQLRCLLKQENGQEGFSSAKLLELQRLNGSLMEQLEADKAVISALEAVNRELKEILRLQYP